MSRPLRYTFILVLVGLGTTLAAVGGWRYARASAPVPGPIILISVDTLRADHLPAYGYRNVRTPAFDTLARDGIVFERAYSHSVQTLPAHAAMLTGRLPFETGVRNEGDGGLKAAERTLPQMLRERGYATGGIVSAGRLRKETGVARGFDFFDADIPASLEQDGLTTDRWQRDGGDSEAIAEHWLSATGSPRVFLFLHLNEPHAPYAPPDRFTEFAPYDGEIAYADEIVGRLLRYLKTHQLYDQSTIVLLSDHGEGLGDHGEQEHGLFVYDEAVHVPLIIKQAGGVGAGRRAADVVQHIDVVPTILDLAKAPVPGNLRGRSLKPQLDGVGRLAERLVYSEAFFGRHHFGWNELTSLTNARFQYIKAPRPELYDLQHDRREQMNLAPDNGPAPEIQQDLRGALDRLTGGANAAVEGAGDPKDKWEVLETYRAGLDLAAERKWTQAIAVLQQILAKEPDAAVVWQELGALAMLADRLDVAVDAAQHVVDLRPTDAKAYVAMAEALLKGRKLDDAQSNAERAAAVAQHDIRPAAHAHALLANIALARHDADGARREAALAHEADSSLPLPSYVDAHLLYDDGAYDEALPLFEQASAEIRRLRGGPVPDLHFLTGETLVRLERSSEAEAEFLEELRDFPHNVRARAALATLYLATERTEEARSAASDLIRLTPTPEGYAVAARLWTGLGDRKQADAVRAEARRVFAESKKKAAPLPRGRH